MLFLLWNRNQLKKRMNHGANYMNLNTGLQMLSYICVCTPTHIFLSLDIRRFPTPPTNHNHPNDPPNPDSKPNLNPALSLL